MDKKNATQISTDNHTETKVFFLFYYCITNYTTYKNCSLILNILLYNITANQFHHFECADSHSSTWNSASYN